LAGDKLVNPKLLLDLPATPGQHHGGPLVIGPDNNVYVLNGDDEGDKYLTMTKAQNFKNGTEPDGRSGILRVTQDGKLVQAILGNGHPLDKYYAYGIRNSFGMDFDPLTGNLWDTENGDLWGDEINLVQPGFNSGFEKIDGVWDNTNGPSAGRMVVNPNDLVDFGGRGKYRDPEFTWEHTVCPTAIQFFDSNKFGKQYENDLFVADCNYGYIYHFDLNDNRTGLLLKGPLADKVTDVNETSLEEGDMAINATELKDIIWAKFSQGITDLEVGPDGFLYVVGGAKDAQGKDTGAIYRIVPT
jgi:glucose/arabinose dehydrogenase